MSQKHILTLILLFLKDAVVWNLWSIFSIRRVLKETHKFEILLKNFICLLLIQAVTKWKRASLFNQWQEAEIPFKDLSQVYYSLDYIMIMFVCSKSVITATELLVIILLLRIKTFFLDESLCPNLSSWIIHQSALMHHQQPFGPQNRKTDKKQAR